MDWKLELIAIPVSDVDRAKSFYLTTWASSCSSTTARTTRSGSCR